MKSLPTALDTYAPRILSVLRIVTALLYLQHGLEKFFDFPMAGPPHLSPLVLAAALLETVGSLLLFVGIFTRPVAFLLSGEMAIAYFMAHAPHSFYPLVNHGEDAVLYCFIFLYLFFAGGGAWSVDRCLSKRAEA